MRKVRLSVAMSLDGYIAGPRGEHEWIIMDKAIDFGAFFRSVDAALLGRKTYEKTRQLGGDIPDMPGMHTYVFSRTLPASSGGELTVSGDPVSTVQELRTKAGKDIWLMGGGGLFRSLLEARLVDVVEVAIIPVLLGEGTQLLTGLPRTTQLDLVDSKVYPSGIVALRYDVRYRERQRAKKTGRARPADKDISSQKL